MYTTKACEYEYSLPAVSIHTQCRQPISEGEE